MSYEFPTSSMMETFTHSKRVRSVGHEQRLVQISLIRLSQLKHSSSEACEIAPVPILQRQNGPEEVSSWRWSSPACCCVTDNRFLSYSNPNRVKPREKLHNSARESVASCRSSDARLIHGSEKIRMVTVAQDMSYLELIVLTTYEGERNREG